MASTFHLGEIRSPVDGTWDIDDLLELSKSLSESTGLPSPKISEVYGSAPSVSCRSRRQWKG